MRRSRYKWQLGGGVLELGQSTLVMGVVNVTPDSFSDGGRFGTPDTAIEHALRLLDEGADILDIGGESTRPGVKVGAKADVSAEQEIERVLPVIKGVLWERPEAVVSIDTYKAQTARAAVGSGARIVNDVSGLTWDPEMARAVAELKCGVVLMHTRGMPEEWKSLPPLEDPFTTVLSGMDAAAKRAATAGIARERIVLDPGLGFGKKMDDNYPLLAHFGEFAKLGFPLLAGPSRKSFVGRTVGQRLAGIRAKEAVDQPADQRLFGTLAAVTACVLQGAHIVRVHDVGPAVEAVAVADAILAAE
jgi:dihydropteroate synthase